MVFLYSQTRYRLMSRPEVIFFVFALFLFPIIIVIQIKDRVNCYLMENSCTSWWPREVLVDDDSQGTGKRNVEGSEVFQSYSATKGLVLILFYWCEFQLYRCNVRMHRRQLLVVAHAILSYIIVSKCCYWLNMYVACDKETWKEWGYVIIMVGASSHYNNSTHHVMWPVCVSVTTLSREDWNRPSGRPPNHRSQLLKSTMIIISSFFVSVALPAEITHCSYNRPTLAEPVVIVSLSISKQREWRIILTKEGFLNSQSLMM